jgi:predicted flap endonuclease-1-like 5' DNA nuclease
VDGFHLQSNGNAKTIYDQQQYIFSCEAELKKQKAKVDQLNASIDSYQYRIQIIEEELEKAKAPVAKSKKTKSLPLVRANYEHVSQLLGRQVTENDLTLILGIGPKTSTLLGKHGIKTWDDLSKATVDILREYLDEAGGIYKAHDPSQWAKQALMAARGEWRKLRVFQEKLRNTV